MSDTSPSDETTPTSGRIERLKERSKRLMEQGLQRLEIESTRRPNVRVVLDFYERDRALAGSLLAGGLAVKLFLWFLPFSLTFVLILGLVGDTIDTPPSDLAADAGLTAALASIVEDAVSTTDRARVYLAIVAVFLLLWTSLGVARALRLVSRLSWRMVSVSRVKPLPSALAVIGFFIAVGALQWLLRLMQLGPFGLDLLAVVIGAGGLAALFTMAFTLLPHPPDVTWQSMVPGALLATIAILLTRLLTIIYFAPGLDSKDDLYGGLGVASVFLAWLYIIGRILVASVSLNATIGMKQARDDPKIDDILEPGG